MDQELFENPRRQYAVYGIEVIEELGTLVVSPEELDNEELDPRAIELLESLEMAHPDTVLTFDVAAQLWIMGAAQDVDRMLAAREAFVDALAAESE